MTDQTEPLTNDYEQESDLDQHEYDRKREIYWSKVIFAERKFNEIKPLLYKIRLQMVSDYIF